MTSLKVTFIHTEAILQRSTDIVFGFFLAYLLSRYSTFATTNKLPIQPPRFALDGAGISLIITALVSYIGVARDNTIPNSQAKFGTVLMTSSLVATGTFAGLAGTNGITAGVICSILSTVCVINRMTIWVPVQLGVLGSIIAGKFMVEADMATGLMKGIVAAVVVTVFAVVLTFNMISAVLVAILSHWVEVNCKRALNLYVGLPTSLCSSLGVGTLAWLCDRSVLDVLGSTSHIPGGLIVGTIFVLICLLLGVL